MTNEGDLKHKREMNDDKLRVVIDWLSVAKSIFRLIKEEITEARFRSLFGISSFVCSVIYNIVASNCVFAALDLLYFLLFAKHYGSETLLALMFDTNEKDYGNRVWQVIEQLHTYLPGFNFIDRFQEGLVGENLISSVKASHLVLDTTSCNIQTPSGGKKVRLQFYSYKKRYQIKYEIAVGIRTGRIYWINGAYAGSMRDSTIVQKSGFLSKLQEGELVLADAIYNIKKLHPHLLAPYKRVPKKHLPSYRLVDLLARARFNKHLRSSRVIVERTIARLKSFGALKQTWRHETTLHPKLFDVICRIVNIDLQYHPL